MIEKLKSELIEKVKPHNPCSSEYKRALSATTESELLSVISDNLLWCIEHDCVSNEYFSKFDPQSYLDSGIANTGKENTGFRNSGNWNSGNWNSGNWNSGNWNSGNWNSGNCNSGNWNSGNCNSGYRNSGYRNSGNCNSGNCNSGYRNSGNWNSGDRNSGNCNSGYRNSGAFCTDQNPTIWLFNKPTNIPVKDWEQSRPYRIMADYLNFTFWIHSNEMTEKEKADHPKYETTEGYLKTIPYKEGWANMWGNLNDKDKSEFTSLPNFDSEIFYEITGIKI